MGDSKKNAGGKFRTALPEGLRLKETYKASESLKSRIMSAACGEDGVYGGRLADGVPGGASAGRDSMSGRRWPRILVRIFGPVAAVLALAGVFLFVPMSSLKATDTVFDMAAGIELRDVALELAVCKFNGVVFCNNAVKHVFRHGTPPQCSLPPRQESTAGKSGQTMGQILTNSSGIIPKFCRNYKKIMGMSKFSQKVLFI